MEKLFTQRVINYLTFVILIVSTALGIQALWGLLFLYWTLTNIRAGQCFLLSPVIRNEDPILFWAIQLTWMAAGIYLVLLDIRFI